MNSFSEKIPGVHPESGLFDTAYTHESDTGVVKTIRDKQRNGHALTMAELMQAGRDDTTRIIGEHQLRSDHVYRAVGRDALVAYENAGAVVGIGEGSEPQEGTNGGVDWYLGAAAVKYASQNGVVLEAPADPRYFTPAQETHAALAKDPDVRHMKSSGSLNPVPMDMVRVIDLSKQ